MMSPDTKNKVEDIIVFQQPPLPRRKHSEFNRFNEKNIHLHKPKNVNGGCLTSKESIEKKGKEAYINTDEDENDIFIEATDSDMSFYNLILKANEEIVSKFNFNSFDDIESKPQIEEHIRDITLKINEEAELIEKAYKMIKTNQELYNSELVKLNTDNERNLFHGIYKMKSFRLEMFIKAIENKILKLKSDLKDLNTLKINFDEQEEAKLNHNECEYHSKITYNSQTNSIKVPEIDCATEIDPIQKYLSTHKSKETNTESRDDNLVILNGILALLLALLTIWLIFNIGVFKDAFNGIYEYFYPKPEPPPNWFYSRFIELCEYFYVFLNSSMLS